MPYFVLQGDGDPNQKLFTRAVEAQSTYPTRGRLCCASLQRGNSLNQLFS